jgi:hypothetical protein
MGTHLVYLTKDKMECKSAKANRHYVDHLQSTLCLHLYFFERNQISLFVCGPMEKEGQWIRRVRGHEYDDGLFQGGQTETLAFTWKNVFRWGYRAK